MENQQNAPQFQYKPPVPNATGALVLGILSIVFIWCYALPGLVMGIVAIVLANKATQTFEANPGMYSESSLGNAKAGKVTGIIGLAVSALVFILIIVYIVILGAVLFHLPWESMSH
ncbi:MAG: hypothetical protein CVU11_09650 [Bacteroidetes bacterium HGW-Bacteroidetes-6]|jgi:uncharacterized membrane protein|nr:MAG: hypothetical protein CVU11_09650 [Bacteroidetes bacterium HGW-Bacteroidetes-6]